MKHAGPRTLAQIEPLLEALRATPVLREPRPGVFHLDRRAFLHFHDDESGIYADVRLADEFVRMRVSTAAKQAELLGQIGECLSTAEVRAAGKQRRESRRG